MTVCGTVERRQCVSDCACGVWSVDCGLWTVDCVEVMGEKPGQGQEGQGPGDQDWGPPVPMTRARVRVRARVRARARTSRTRTSRTRTSWTRTKTKTSRTETKTIPPSHQCRAAISQDLSSCQDPKDEQMMGRASHYRLPNC